MTSTSPTPIGFNYLGRLGAGAGESGDGWQISWDGLSNIDAGLRLPMPLAHTVELNAGIIDTDFGPFLARRLVVGAVGAGSREGQPAGPIVVRCPVRDLRECTSRRGAG